MKHYKQRSYALLAALLLNAPAWSMDMSGMSDMDMSMPAKKAPLQKTKAKHPLAKPAKHATQSIAQTETSMQMDDDTSMTHAANTSPDHHTMDMKATETKNMPMSDMTHHDMHHMSMPMNDMMMDHVHDSMPVDARSSDYSQGRDFGPIHPPMMMGNDPLMSLAVKRLEWQHSHDNNQGVYDIEGWWGDDWNRAVLKAEGTVANQNSHESISDARTELLWRRPLGTFWNTELGIRQDSGYENNRTWAAFGINGIAPYWFDLDATLYVRDQSQTELRFTGEYDWRITQRLILQPRIEMSLYSKNDLSNDIGEGLSQVQSSLRLRYEINRQFAPYLGFENNHHYGKTADLMNAAHQSSDQSLAIAGVMFWF
ncbi:MAG: copper resistance protein B [Gammaproteobacteria bacterium]|nr:copper resistance protein B [Gammaproteobacteria bacterium]